LGTTEITELMLSGHVVVLGNTDSILCWSTLSCHEPERFSHHRYLRVRGAIGTPDFLSAIKKENQQKRGVQGTASSEEFSLFRPGLRCFNYWFFL
jgi:hypothetical protein